MTLEEIRREKEVAEQAIEEILKTLKRRTTLLPQRVDINVSDSIAIVTITLEGI